MKFSPKQRALLEEFYRRRARSGLVAFTEGTFPQYRAERVHHHIAARLEAVLRGECSRLIIVAPPQHGKSELVSVRFPAFWLGNRPDDPVILASYGADLAYSKSRRAREIVESTEYQALFPGVRTRRDSRAVNSWELAPPYRGGLIAAGVGGPITGHGALLGIIDDPVENWEQAHSDVYREKIWQWYKGTFRTRIWEGGAIVLIMTRWHEDDLAGRLLAEQAEQWEVLHLPAVSEGEGDPLGRPEGEPLSPERFSREALAQIEQDVGSQVWSAEYQGRPSPLEGNMFKREAVGELLKAAPAAMTRWIRYWDKAGTENGGDWTAGVLFGRCGNLYIVLDVVRGQWSAATRKQVMHQTAQMDAAQYPGMEVWVEQEPGSSGKESAENTIADLAGFAVHAETSTGSKVIRANPLSAQWEVGNVKLLEGAWNKVYLDEMSAFPNGVHDDMVDASAGAFAKLATVKHEAGVQRYA